MKAISLRTVVLAAPLFGLVAVYGACAPDDPTVDNPTGGAAGTTSNAGTQSTAGTPAMTGGSAGTPGVGGSTGGAAGGMGGSGVGTGGSGAGAGGTAGGGGMAGGCSDKVACIDEVASAMSDFGNPGWKDSWWVTGCYKKQQHDCLLNEDAECHSSDGDGVEDKGARTVESWKLGGEPGQKYKVSFEFNAVTEAKRYKGGTRDVQSVAGDPHTNTPLDMFYRGGSLDATNYNVVKLTVYDNNMMPVSHYYMNAAPEGGDLNQWEGHYTFLASYKKSIVVVGGGKVEHKVQDTNCHAIDNCGPAAVSGTTCAASRKLPGASGDLMLPAKYKDPRDNMVKDTPQLSIGPYPGGGRAQPWHSQAGHLKITAIEKTNDPIDMKYPDPQ